MCIVRKASTMIITVLVLLAIPIIASAHAVLVGSSPKDGATIRKSPSKIILRFDARIEKALSQAKLLDAKDKEVTLKVPKGGYTEGASNVLIIPIPKLKPGAYRLEYQVLATDGHLTPGLVRFTISGGKSK